ncbi:MAG TPA: DNA polymerase III subunit gamma/tau, partial [Afifellaceae bacterium]|nr:DNA polymerase III subunit gamma/tau [Afifellaceae bacterium]
QVRPIHFEEGRLEIAVDESADPGLVQRLMQALQDWTGRRWVVAVGRAAEGRTLHDERQARKAELLAAVRADPLVERVLAQFPGAEIVAVRDIVEEAGEHGPARADAEDELPAWLDEAPPPDTFDGEPPEEDD